MMKVNLTSVLKAKHIVIIIVFNTNCIRSSKQNSRVVINNTSLFPGPLLFCPPGARETPVTRLLNILELLTVRDINQT